MEGRKVNGANGIEHQVADFSPREHPAPASLPQGFIERLEKALAIFSKWATVIAGVALVGMLVVTIADVIGNKLFRQPIQGASEYLSFLAVITTAFAISFSMIEKAHVQVDVFISKLPPRWKAFFEAFIALLSLGIFVLLTWVSVRLGMQLQKSGELSMTQRIPMFPLAYALAFAFFPACLYLLLEFLRWGKKVVNR